MGQIVLMMNYSQMGSRIPPRAAKSYKSFGVSILKGSVLKSFNSFLLNHLKDFMTEMPKLRLFQISN